jgi:hypothetical protein
VLRRGTKPKGACAHYASGDDNLKSTTFRNFTAAYPPASAISEMSLISVSNVANLQPYVQFFVGPNAVFGVSWNVVRKVTTADSVYGPIGTIITMPNSRALDVAQIGQADLTWDMSRFVQLHALYAHQGRRRPQLRLLPAADYGAMVSWVTLAPARVRYTSTK